MQRILAISGLVLALGVTPAFAVTTQADVVAACTTSTAALCSAAINAYILESGKTGAELDKLLGELAYKLVTSPNLTAATGALVAAALQTIATQATSPELKATITSFASDAADGTVQSIPPAPPSAANPSGN
jgi:hypothetical protein